MLSSSLLLGSILFPFGAYATLIVFRFRKARVGFQWLSAFVGMSAAWFLLIGLRFFLPHFLPLATWQPETLFPLSPSLLADGFSWPIGFALATVGGAVILTESSTQEVEFSFGWANSILLVGLGFFAIFAGNQLTLLLAWAAIDLVELAIWFSRPFHPTLRERVILAFASRALGVMVSLWGFGNPWAYVLAVILRWGVFPFHLPYLESPDLRRGLGTIIRLVPPLTTMPLLARLADLAYFSSEGLLVIFLGFLALFAAILWINSSELLESRPFWIIGTASFAFYAATLHRPEAVVAWAMIMAFCGSFLFLIRGRDRFWLVGLGFQILFLVGVPFTPFWDIVKIYHLPLSIGSLIFFLAHLLMLGGYLRFVVMVPSTSFSGEPWRIALYFLAFIGLIGASWIIGYGNWDRLIASALSRAELSPRGWVEYTLGLGLLVVGVGGAGFAYWGRLPRWRLPSNWVSFLSMHWLYRALQGIFRLVGNLFYQIEAILEGRGGILWAFVLLLILARFFLLVGGGE